jgi:polyphosphate:AMP phosphotransferase
MLDQIDLAQRIGRSDYRERRNQLRDRLQAAMAGILEARVPVAVVVEGWAGTAKVRTIGVMTRRLDPRGVRVHSIVPPGDAEQPYPWLYRFWRLIPSHGRVSFFDRSWYREVIEARARHGMSAGDARDRCSDIVTLERQWIDDGAIILKFWLHISRREQRRRFQALLADRLTAWQVTDDDRWQHRNYDRVARVVEEIIARSHTPAAPWHIVPATCARTARLAVMETVVTAFERRLGIDPAEPVAPLSLDGALFRRIKDEPRQSPAMRQPVGISTDGAGAPVLRHVDLSPRADAASYSRQLAELQALLHLLGTQVYRQRRPVVLVFEGWDAAGKGGAIQRVTEELDPRSFVVHAIAAPSGEDALRHYLYRFWRRLPPRGQIGIFDRSWYGRVLVERVEGFARDDEWRRAYDEINEFEHQLVAFGAIIAKFWLHISADEQLRRFQERQTVAHKSWKLTDEDWRNRERWPQYEEAADEMLRRTSTADAPWTIIESEDKRYGRLKVLRTLVQRLEAELGRVQL